MVDIGDILRYSLLYMDQYPGLTIKTTYSPYGDYINYHIDNFKAGSHSLAKGTFGAYTTDEAISKLNFVIIDFSCKQ